MRRAFYQIGAIGESIVSPTNLDRKFIARMASRLWPQGSDCGKAYKLVGFGKRVNLLASESVWSD
jgi:hypothetical protein